MDPRHRGTDSAARILVVEDNYDEAADMRAYLEGWGHTVPAVVSTAEKAIAEAGNQTLDLALLDIRLPGQMDGIHLAEVLSQRWKVPSLFVSAYTDEDTLARAGAVRPRGFVSKPFMADTLRSAVEVALRHGGPVGSRRPAGAPPWDKLDGLATLCGGVSHQLNNLLTVVMGSAALLRDRFGTDAVARNRLKQIEEAAQSAGHVTQQMLVFSQDSCFEPQQVDIDVLAAECAHQAGENGSLVELDLRAPETPIEADPNLVRLIFANLLSNAREATKGKGLVRMRTQPVSLPPDKQHPGEQHGILISVVDDGCGMPPEDRARAFEPFFSTKGPGRGLGLAAVYGAVAKQGGNAAIESKVGQGTAVYVWLPVKLTALDGQGSGREGGGESTSKKTILVVDDETMVLRTIEMLLKHAGYSVLTATNGREALDVASEQCGHIDCILLDIVMPVMSGYEALPDLRTLCPEAPIVVLTGFADRGERDPELRKEIYTVLKKPISRAALCEVLSEALASKT